MDQTSSKSVFKSKTVWGGAILAATSFIHNHTGVNIADQVQVAEAALSAIYADLTQIAQPVGALVGSILVVYGRVRASQPIALKTPGTSTPAPTLSPISPLAKISSVAAAATLALTLGLAGCATPGGGSGSATSPGGTLNFANVETVLNTAANVIEQLNSTALTVAPTAETVLTMLHNQGDAQVLSNAASTDAALVPAINQLLDNVQGALDTAQDNGTSGKAAQQTAVSDAISPSAVAKIATQTAQ